MRRNDRFRSRRGWWIMLALGVGSSGLTLFMHRYVMDQVWAFHISYEAGCEVENAEYELRMREMIAQLRRCEPCHEADAEFVDEVFDRLQLSRVACNSRQVAQWRWAPHSPERRDVALRWAVVAADEAAQDLVLHRLARRDLEAGRMPHHVTESEVPALAMPAGWTPDDVRR